jgi:hypothetical protein
MYPGSKRKIKNQSVCFRYTFSVPTLAGPISAEKERQEFSQIDPSVRLESKPKKTKRHPIKRHRLTCFPEALPV